jgi:UDP-glucose 4-epimerase
MKILVTGGAGFIGSHLCEELVKIKKYTVTSLDNYSMGVSENHVSGVTYINGDTNNIQDLIKFTPDVVFHLGEYSRVEQSFNDIEKVWHSNKDGTFRVLEFCRKKDCKLVYAGSSTKFGDGGLGRNQSPYGWTKAANTELVVNYGAWYGVEYAIVYFYNAYGPREIKVGKYATLIGIFEERFKQHKSLTVVSPGSQIRNFTHVKDIVNGIILVGEKGVGDEFGIGSKKSYSVLEIADMFGGKVEMLSPRKGNRMSAEVLVEKTINLGWLEKYNLSDYVMHLKQSMQFEK